MPGKALRFEGQTWVSGERIAYVLLKTPGRRHVHLMIDDDGRVEIRAPYRFAHREAHFVLASNARWIATATVEWRERVARRPRLESGSVLPFLDERLRLSINPVEQRDLFADASALEEGGVSRRGAELRVRVAAPSPGAVRSALEEWYKREAQTYLPSRARQLGQALGLTPRGISIRGQRTRWGSCSQAGNISLNWRLMLLSGALSDYVLVHELCHLAHLDHSRRYWALVSSVVPDYRQCEASLKRVQGSLAL